MRNLLLVGCGHAHLFVLEALRRKPLQEVRVTLVSAAEDYFYSGMIPGVMAGCYRAEEARLQPAKLAESSGVNWVCGHVSRLDIPRGAAVLTSGAPLPFELVSLDVGSRLQYDHLPGIRKHALAVKPMRTALAIVSRATALIDGALGRPARLLIVGGGAAGVEIAFCLQARYADRGVEAPEISILHGEEHILEEHPDSFRSRAEALLRAKDIRVVRSARVTGSTAEHALVEDGGAEPFDLLIWATGPRAPSLVKDSGLPADGAGYLRVDASLRSTGPANVFGAGDCVSIVPFPWVPKAGVYAVREGPILAANLRRALAGRPLRSYTPQRHWLSLMNTGDGRALLSYRGVSGHGRALWWLKDRIDRRFMDRFRSIQG
jgi:pyridine nucleotide-disulfide oxidoreductase family protein